MDDPGVFAHSRVVAFGVPRRRVLAGGVVATVAMIASRVLAGPAPPETKSAEVILSSGDALRVGAAFPDPPFNGMPGDAGLDIDLMTAIAGSLGRTAEMIAFQGADFNGIFDALAAGDYDCVAAGTTVTPERQNLAAFAKPYLVSGQSLAVDTVRLPQVRSIDDLAGLTIGVQQGNTSQPIANRLVADGKAGAVRVYDYGDIRSALNDLTTGACDVFMKLAPVLTELVKPIPGLAVVQRTGISVEGIAIAVPKADQALLARIDAAQSALEGDGTLPRLRRKWLGDARLDQSQPAT